MRYGSLSVATSVQSRVLAAVPAAISRPASEISPSTSRRSAPVATHSARVISGAPVGIATSIGRPARAAYAAQAAPALPLVGIARADAPSSRARETPAAAPRALNDPVGSSPSSLTSSRGTPSSAPSAGAGSSGVIPSPRVMTCSGAVTGSSSW